ncbi:riboflavin synthase [Aeromicrobium fastidiosum]|uniref:riboflavin synthase n=1 Tax=Aeromicrobium TaxID=2040 RepID=UPI001780BEA6|nr:MULTISPECIES: riboflavin synthase [Aeromicrobium]MBD8606195.1 riboflavin synthase [Aeromicrobium sp. CFBP 8757]MCL8251081.1 riboflavin synthase [Aeromicrobium fastidiosum]
MFTGLVEEKGTVTAVEQLGDSVRLTIRGPVVTSDAGHGDSISVNGCCLTVMTQDGDTFGADVMQESLDKTSLGDLTIGSPVNLERATQAGARLGGHIVQGHVDGTGRILDRTPSEHWEVVRVSLPSELARYLVDKGSVTVDGTSLTVVEVVDDGPDGPWFSVSLIPTTLADTTLGTKAPGDRVNLEVDILAKYVERLLGASPQQQNSQGAAS